MMSVQANTGPPWPEKNATAFWRGRDSRQERLALVKLSRAHPDVIDAAFTNFFFFKHDESLYGPLVKHVSFFDFFKVRWVPLRTVEFLSVLVKERCSNRLLFILCILQLVKQTGFFKWFVFFPCSTLPLSFVITPNVNISYIAVAIGGLTVALLHGYSFFFFWCSLSIDSTSTK